MDSKDETQSESQIRFSELVSCVVNEIEVLEKEIELMKLRVSECTDRATEQTIRNFGSCLWRHKRALEQAIAANGGQRGRAADFRIETLTRTRPSLN